MTNRGAANLNIEISKPTDSDKITNVSIGLEPVSYTHLDVYKRQLSIRNKISEKMYGIRRYFIGVNNKKDNYFCYSL